MKWLKVTDLNFILPDNFEGNVTDALELLVEYRKSNAAKKKRLIGEGGKSDKENGFVNPASETAVFEVNDNKRKLSMNVALLEVSNPHDPNSKIKVLTEDDKRCD